MLGNIQMMIASLDIRRSVIHVGSVLIVNYK